MPARTHGESQGKSLLYGIWCSMRSRCNLPTNEAYPYYGARGIRVAPEWNRDYLTFKSWAIAHGYQQGLEIDRRDNEGDYEPSNCHWVTPRANARNRRSNVILTAFGESKTLIEWSEDPRCVPSYMTLYHRVMKHHWEHERAITQQVRRKLP